MGERPYLRGLLVRRGDPAVAVRTHALVLRSPGVLASDDDVFGTIGRVTGTIALQTMARKRWPEPERVAEDRTLNVHSRRIPWRWER